MEQALAMIFWLGQACFVIQTGDVTILTDPYHPKMGYEVQTVKGIDIVTVSHEHSDHAYVAMAAGSPLILRGLSGGGKEFNRIDQTVKGVRFYSVDSYHDPEAGKQRGRNAIFVIEVQSVNPPLRIVHMGDFGENRLGEERIKAIGNVDVLLVPVGGYYTIGPAEADQLVADLKPKVVIPMHWKTARTPRLPIADVSPFLAGKKNVVRDGPVSGNRLALTRSLLERAEKAGGPMIVPLDFGLPPAAPSN